MNLHKKMKFSIQDRLRLATTLSVVSFIVIALILLAAFLQVRIDLGQVVETQLQKTVSNSHLALDLGQFLSRIKQLEATFYGHDEYLQQEGAALQQLLKKLQRDVYGSALQPLYPPLQQKLVAYLEQCKKVNELLRRRRQEDQALIERFDLLEEVLAEQMIKAAQRGEPQDYYEQLTLLIAEYRGDLLDIIRHNLQENRATLFKASFFDPPPNAANISALALKLKTIAASKEPINRFGRHLIDQLKYYQHLMTRYQQEMIHLGRRTDELNRGTQQALLQLATLDQRHKTTAARAVKEVDRTILAAGAVVLALLVVLALVLGLIHLNLFSRHIKQPMEKIRDRLLRFREGDYRSPMALNRDDEWGQIDV
ncbi:MAG: hypothetical protein GXP51_03265 [Deltaproteobacteria bacterium]|nr:hypothetical protein [Deltaproteobacteria bacterium]